MSERSTRPLVGVVSDVQTLGPHVYHTAGDKYLRALVEASGALPVVIPCLADVIDAQEWVERIDGLFFPGAYSMLDPSHYGETRLPGDYFYDAHRDTLSFALFRQMLAANKPVFAVCRGLQDINVALGGTLHQAVHAVDGMQDHREDKNASIDVQYGPAHRVTLTQGGLMHTLCDTDSLTVNSVHSQGIRTLAPGLEIEARADDGLIEAFRIPQLSFGLAVQWHPEWRVSEHPHQFTLFKAFGDACRNAAALRTDTE